MALLIAHMTRCLYREMLLESSYIVMIYILQTFAKNTTKSLIVRSSSPLFLHMIVFPLPTPKTAIINVQFDNVLFNACAFYQLSFGL